MCVCSCVLVYPAVVESSRRIFLRPGLAQQRFWCLWFCVFVFGRKTCTVFKACFSTCALCNSGNNELTGWPPPLRSNRFSGWRALPTWRFWERSSSLITCSSFNVLILDIYHIFVTSLHHQPNDHFWRRARSLTVSLDGAGWDQLPDTTINN